jgi:hypothetical protein
MRHAAQVQNSEATTMLGEKYCGGGRENLLIVYERCSSGFEMPNGFITQVADCTTCEGRISHVYIACVLDQAKSGQFLLKLYQRVTSTDTEYFERICTNERVSGQIFSADNRLEKKRITTFS